MSLFNSAATCIKNYSNYGTKFGHSNYFFVEKVVQRVLVLGRHLYSLEQKSGKKLISRKILLCLWQDLYSTMMCV